MTRAARLAGLVVAALAVLLIGAEILFRIAAGERFLYRADPAIEYLPQPNQSVRRRGVLLETNAWGMRSPQVERNKPDGVFRVLVLGDSVVFGHTNIGQPDLATTLLGAVSTRSARRLEVLNVSAPSWGPGNLLAWVNANGLFGADAAVIVLSSHDLDDDRAFSPPDPEIYPQEQPALVLADWLNRQLNSDNGAQSPDPRSPGDARRSLPPLLARVVQAPQGACLVVHATTAERTTGAQPGAAAELAKAAAAAGLVVIYDRDFIDVASGYVDDIHLSSEGQARLAAAMKSCPALVAELES